MKKIERKKEQGTHQRQKSRPWACFWSSVGCGGGQAHTEHKKHVHGDMLFVLEGGVGVMLEASDESLTKLAMYFRNWHMFREYMNNIAC